MKTYYNSRQASIEGAADDMPEFEVHVTTVMYAAFSNNTLETTVSLHCQVHVIFPMNLYKTLSY